MSSPLGKLKPEIKARWQAKLESGEYPQDKHQLRSPRGFCCLGVLGDLAVEDGLASWDENVLVVKSTGQREPSSFPVSLLEWAFGAVPDQAVLEGRRTTNFPFEARGTTDFPFDLCLTEQNDSAGLTFPEISKLIKEHF